MGEPGERGAARDVLESSLDLLEEDIRERSC